MMRGSRGAAVRPHGEPNGVVEMNAQQQLRARIQAILDRDPRLASSMIRVSITQGVVTLTGRVPRANLKPVARALTVQVDGVADVVNDLTVGNQATEVDAFVSRRTTMADADLAQRVRAALSEDAELSDLPITMAVTGAQVTLTGVVDTWHRGLQASARVRAVDGVGDIVNQLVPQSLYDALVQLRTQSGTSVSDGPVRFTLSNRSVTVDGSVRSWDEKQAVLEAIAESGTTDSILDRVRVEPLP
jgi:osmotically-inducible protein OsmY